MNKKIIKILFLFIIIFSLFFIFFTQYSFGISPEEIVPHESSDASNKIGKFISAAINFTKVVAIGIAIIMLVVLALKYMSSAPNDRAEIKKHAVVYVVGALVLFSVSGILSIIQLFAKNITM